MQPEFKHMTTTSKCCHSTTKIYQQRRKMPVLITFNSFTQTYLARYKPTNLSNTEQIKAGRGNDNPCDIGRD